MFWQLLLKLFIFWLLLTFLSPVFAWSVHQLDASSGHVVSSWYDHQRDTLIERITANIS